MFPVGSLLEEEIDAHVARYTKPRLEAALGDPLLFSDRRQSPLAAGYRIYKGAVIDMMRDCARGGETTLDAFGRCIETVATSSPAESNIWSETPRALEFVSGVRDRVFALDPHFAFLQRGPDAPLQFLIQDTNADGTASVWSFETLKLVNRLDPPGAA